MPYRDNSDLPENVSDVLPGHAQDIYREAYNSAVEQYKDSDDRRGNSDREETAHRVAWSAVKKRYRKTDNGNWQPK